MVNQYDTTFIQHIRRMKELIEKIHRYTDYKSYEDFKQDEMRIDACITALTQLWEIANIIKKQEYTPYNTTLPTKEMTEMRNFLVHTYHKVDVQILRKTITESLPALEEKIDKILNKK